MKTRKRLTAAFLSFSMLLSLLGGGFPSAAASQAAATVTTASELAYDPLAQAASIAYEQHEEGYTVSLDRAADSVTMNLAAVPGDESSRAAEKARLYIQTGAALRPGATYQVSFALSAKQAQPEYAVCFDSGSAEAAYGTLNGRSIEAGGTDRVRYRITPQEESGELVLRLLLGKTGAAGNTLRLSDLAVEEAPGNETGQNAVLADKLDYREPGFIRLWTHTDSAAVITSDGQSATLNVTKEPADGAEVWKIKLLVATGLNPKAGRTYHFTADAVSTAARSFELCYNEGDNEKGFGAKYSQRLTGKEQKLDYMIHIPEDKKDAGELILQFSLGMLKTGDKVTIRNISLEEATPKYIRVPSGGVSLNDKNTYVDSGEPTTTVTDAKVISEPMDWTAAATITKGGDTAEFLSVSQGAAILDIVGDTEKNRVFDAVLRINTNYELTSGHTYRVSFDIGADRSYTENCEILYGNENSDRDYDGIYDYRPESGPLNTVSRQFTVEEGKQGRLLLTLQLGATNGWDNTVEVSNLTIEEVGEGTLSDRNLAGSLVYPSEAEAGQSRAARDAGQFRARDNDGTISGDGSSATITFDGKGVDDWKHGLCIDDICTLVAGADYEISYRIWADKETKYTVSYNNKGDFPPAENVFGEDGKDRNLVAKPEWQTVTDTIGSPTEGGSLWLRLNLGWAKGETKVTITEIKVTRTDSGAPTAQPDVSVTYPETKRGTFKVRDYPGDNYNSGILTGDTKSATLICSMIKGSQQSGDGWQRGLHIEDLCELTEGVQYKVSFQIKATKPTEVTVHYNRDDDWDKDTQTNFFGQETKDVGETPVTVEHPIKAEGTGQLRLLIDLGTAEAGTAVTVSDVKVEAVDGDTTPTDVTVSSVSYPQSTEVDSKKFRVRDSHNGPEYGIITGDGNSVAITFTGNGSGDWARGLCIDDICNLTAGVDYKISYQIRANKDTKYAVSYNCEDDYADGKQWAFGHDLRDTLVATSDWKPYDYTIGSATQSGSLWMRLDLGLANGDTVFQIKDIQVTAVDDGAVPPAVTVDYPQNAKNGQFRVRDDHNGSKYGIITGDGDSATITFTGDGSGDWARGLCIDDICNLTAGVDYKISYEIWANKDTKYAVSYNCEDDYADGKQWAFGHDLRDTLVATTKWETVEYPIGSETKSGSLWMRLDLGLASGEAKTEVSIRNITVTRTDSDSSGATTAQPEVSLTYPETAYGAFKVRDYPNDNYDSGILTGDKNSATLICSAIKGSQQSGDDWQRGLHIEDLCELTGGGQYKVSFQLKASKPTEIKVHYNRDDDWADGTQKDFFGTETKDVSETPVTVEHPITAKGTGQLRLLIDLGTAEAGTEVTVSDIQVTALDGGAVQPTVTVTYPLTANIDPGNFRLRDANNGALTGDKSSAAITFTGDGRDDWRQGLSASKICDITAGANYVVRYTIKADHEVKYTASYNKDGDFNDEENGIKRENVYGSAGSFDNPLYITEEWQTVEYPINHAEADGELWLRLNLGWANGPTVVTVRDIQVHEVEYPTTLLANVNRFCPVWKEEAGDKGYRTELKTSSGQAEFTVEKDSAVASENYYAKLCIRTGVIYDKTKAYRASFDITAENAQNEFVVLWQGVPDSEDIRGTWGLSVGAGETKTVMTRPIPAEKFIHDKGELILQLELGKLDGTSNTFTVGNVKVEEVDLDIRYDYLTELSCRGSAARLEILKSPIAGTLTPEANMECTWAIKLFADPDVYASKGDTFRVTFDLQAKEAMNFEVCYNRKERNGRDTESGYGSTGRLHAASKKLTSVEHFFTATRDGNLILQFMLGEVTAPNRISITNIRVERVAYSYSGKSALPAAPDYRAPGAVSYWAHEDYTTTFTGTDKGITANITSAPEKGAEPWKIKLFLDTGVALQPGKYYKVTSIASAKAAQSYEICYNNGGVEMGYDALGGLQLAGGEPQMVERIISVPADKKDTGNLMLQFNLGRTNAANAVTVSGVKVEEVSLSYNEMMEKDFAYTADGTVRVWTNPDYTAALEGADGKATLHITDVPATGAEVWKVQMLVHTGAVLSAGRTYLVRADLQAAKAQNYEVCFNNEETEKGFDALYNQALPAGSKTTVERKISVPASMTDAGELVLQFSVGGAAANDITVSGVSVQELNFGTGGSGNPAPDTVIGLYQAPRTAAGTLDITREKLTYRMTKISSEARDNAVAIAGANLCAGDRYTVAFTARTNKDLTGMFAFQTANGETAVLSEPFRLTSKETAYSFTTAEALSEGGFYDLLWQFGSAVNQELGSADVEISHIAVYSAAETLEITHGMQNMTVNGTAVHPDTYNINGSTYLKPRDLAVLLNDTDAQFVVRSNKKSHVISLTTGKPYTPVGGELTAGENRAASCARSAQAVTVNGKPVMLKSYAIGEDVFFRLCDLDDLLGFKLDYIPESGTAAITSPLTPEAQEKAHAYDIFFLPEIDGESQPYVGDTMPYYENGTFYIYYLKDGGDSYNHSVYLTTTRDFVHYTELDNPVLSASREDVQDNWIGTGSVVKVDNTYYFFYTGYNASGSQEYHEKIMVARGSSPTSFEKVSGWEIVPPASLGQKTDFRDPQAYYDPGTQTISLTVTAAQDGAARILKYTLGKELQNVRYDGIIYTDPTGAFWNLECSDTFQIGNKWYLTYSGQEDTLWYAMADSRFGPYTNPARLEGKLFYAAKHVEDGKDSYMVGWARRANSASSTQEVSGWAGNVAVQKLRQLEDGRLALVPVDSIVSSFKTQKELVLGAPEATLTAGSGYSYKEAFTSCESFMLKGEFTYTGTGSFGLAFDFNGKAEQYKFISLDPAENKLSLSFNEGTTPITETQAALRSNQKHSFTYIQDGSIGIFYLDNQAALLVRLYGATDKPICLFAENNSVTFTSLEQYTP